MLNSVGELERIGVLLRLDNRKHPSTASYSKEAGDFIPCTPPPLLLQERRILVLSRLVPPLRLLLWNYPFSLLHYSHHHINMPKYQPLEKLGKTSIDFCIILHLPIYCLAFSHKKLRIRVVFRHWLYFLLSYPFITPH